MINKKEILEHIKITKEEEGDILIVESSYNIEGIYLFLKQLYENIIYRIFNKVDIKLITINPGKHSLCYELSNNVKLIIGKDNLIISSVEEVSNNFLGDVINSLDFEVGNAIILMDDVDNIREAVNNIYVWTRDQSERKNCILKNVFCYCEADGYVFYIVNTGLSINDLKLIGAET